MNSGNSSNILRTVVFGFIDFVVNDGTSKFGVLHHICIGDDHGGLRPNYLNLRMVTLCSNVLMCLL